MNKETVFNKLLEVVENNTKSNFAITEAVRVLNDTNVLHARSFEQTLDENSKVTREQVAVSKLLVKYFFWIFTMVIIALIVAGGYEKAFQFIKL